MTYALAKELKDAGFLQIGAFGHQLFASGDRGATVEQCNKYPDLVAYAPTLEELIEACRERFFRLSLKQAGSWLAEGRSYAFGEGSTPSEAVARLWLALNKK